AEDGREAHLRFRRPAFGGRTRAAPRRGARVRFGAARRPRRLEPVGGAGVADAVAVLFDVTGAGRRAADRRALAVGRAGGARTGAGLGHVADAGCGAALDGRGLEGVGRARAVRPGAELGLVARAHGPAALERRGLEQVGWAAAARAGTELGDVAAAGRRAAERGRRLESAGG